IRLVAEVILLCGALLYILAALRESKFLGYHMFIENLMTAPSRVMFLFSCCLMMIVPFLRLTCLTELDDHVSVVIMLTTAPYFLFFCRGFKTVGPFVVMIYRMVMGDLLRFVSIYLVFVMGFAQSYFIIFLSFDNPATPEGIDDSETNPVPSAMESIVAMFLMSLTNFGDYYGTMERTNHEMEAKILFVIFMVIVAVLLVNMLIAMMGNTYQKIAETRNEWQRQWARIVLVVERGVAPAERLRNLKSYSQPMSDGRRALVLRLNMSDADKEEMKEILEMKRIHDRLKKKRTLERELREKEKKALRDKILGREPSIEEEDVGNKVAL
ncbi:Transient receptor potential cation channel subfamily V member 5, partial [Pseudolycoriella hygida]